MARFVLTEVAWEDAENRLRVSQITISKQAMTSQVYNKLICQLTY